MNLYNRTSNKYNKDDQDVSYLDSIISNIGEKIENEAKSNNQSNYMVKFNEENNSYKNISALLLLFHNLRKNIKNTKYLSELYKLSKINEEELDKLLLIDTSDLDYSNIKTEIQDMLKLNYNNMDKITIEYIVKNILKFYNPDYINNIDLNNLKQINKELNNTYNEKKKN